MHHFGNFLRFYWLLVLVLCVKHCFTRRLREITSHPWNPSTWIPHKDSEPLTARQATLSNEESEITEDDVVLAGRTMDGKDENSEDTVAINEPERALGGIYTTIPYQAGILYQKHFRCGATFVTVKNTYFFLTAASCVVRHFGDSHSPDKLENFEFFVGATDVRSIDPSLKYKPDKIVIHPCYNSQTKVGNLAIAFSRDFVHQVPGQIHAARLPLEEGYPFPIDVTASGFGGENRYNEYFGYLNKLDIGSWDQSFCRNFGWHPGFFCVVDMKPSRPRGICQGDEGGPIVGEYEVDVGENFNYVAGIISHVANDLPCQTKGVPTLITQTSLYLPWILEEVHDRHNSPYKRECIPVDCSKTEC